MFWVGGSGYRPQGFVFRLGSCKQGFGGLGFGVGGFRVGGRGCRVQTVRRSAYGRALVHHRRKRACIFDANHACTLALDVVPLQNEPPCL